MRGVEPDIGEALVVLEEHVEARLVRLDERVLEHQGLGLGARDRHLDVAHLADQEAGLAGPRRAAEIARDALFQVARLADVQDLAPAPSMR
jgi:hypothetical protein